MCFLLPACCCYAIISISFAYRELLDEEEIIMTEEVVVDLAFEMSTGRIETEKERKEYMKKVFTVGIAE